MKTTRNVTIRHLPLSFHSRLLAAAKEEEKEFFGNVSLDAMCILAIKHGLDHLESIYKKRKERQDEKDKKD